MIVQDLVILKTIEGLINAISPSSIFKPSVYVRIFNSRYVSHIEIEDCTIKDIMIEYCSARTSQIKIYHLPGIKKLIVYTRDGHVIETRYSATIAYDMCVDTELEGT